MATLTPSPVETIYGGTVVRVTPQGDRSVCQLSRGAPLLVSRVVGRYLGTGDDMASGRVSSEIADISPANCASSSLPIDPDVSTAITISPTPWHSTDGKYRPEAI